LRCGAGHFLEHAIGNNWFDPWTGKWDTEEHRKENEEENVCAADKEA